MTFKELRISKNLTQREIAEPLHILPSAVQHWESGRTKPCRKYRDTIANIMGVTRAELDRMIDGEEDLQ